MLFDLAKANNTQLINATCFFPIRLIPKRTHLICLAYTASFKCDQYLIKRYTEFRLCHAKRCIGKALNLTSQRPKHIALKVTFCFASAGENRIKYSGSFEFVPQRIKLTFVIFCIFSIPLIFCRLSHYFRFALKTSPADTEPRV